MTDARREVEREAVVGSRIKFRGEKQRYTVQARSERFVICTKPFNAKKTVIYTIIDFERGHRGCDNMIFGRGYETREACESVLAELERGTVALSWRNYGPLNIESISP